MMTMAAGMMDKQAHQVIEYLKEENRILREKLGNRRIQLSDNQHRRLTVKAKPLGRKILQEVTDLFSPETILGWYRKLIAAKYDGSANRKGGRPKVRQEVIDLVLKFKQENARWGYRQIRNYLVYLGFPIGATTVKQILQDHGFSPDPDMIRKTTWKEFINSHMEVMAATDFFSVELLTKRGLVRCMVLFVIELATRKVEIAGIKADPNGTWMKQVARNLTDGDDGFLNGKRYLIHDRDPLFTKDFQEIIGIAGVQVVKTPKQSPNLNAFAERFIWSIKFECLNHLILTSPEQLEYVIKEYLDYYHHERIHQALGRIIEPRHEGQTGEIACIERLGGLLKSYHRRAA